MSRRSKILNIRYFMLQLLFWCEAVIVYAYMTPILEAKGYSEVEIGILIGIKLLIGMIFQIWIGDYADRHRYSRPLKYLITILSILSAIFTLAIIATGHNFILMLIISIGYGISFTTISPLVDSLSMLYVSHGEDVNFAMGRMGGSISWAFFCVLAGKYCDTLGIATLPVCGIISAVLLAGVAFTMPWKKIKLENNIFQQTKKNSKPHSARYLLKTYPTFTIFLLGAAVMFMGYNFGTTFMIDIISGLGGSNTDYGMVEFVMAIAEVPSAFLVLRLKDKIPIKWMMLCCAIFMTIKNVIPTYASSVTMVILAQCCEFLGFGLFYAGSVYLIAKMLPDADAVKANMLLCVVTLGLGEGLASLFSGMIKRQLGLYGLMKIASLTNAAAILIMLCMCLIKDEKNKSVDSGMIP